MQDAAAIAAEAAKANVEYWKAAITAFGVVVGALVAAIVGTIGAALITARVQRRRNAQDRESQWRTHAIELTKLDADRLMKRAKEGQIVRPFILTFLANYRDLQELGKFTPGELYVKIIDKRINAIEGAHILALSGTDPFVVECTGGLGDAGHPKVALNVSTEVEAICPYCSRHYILARNARDC